MSALWQTQGRHAPGGRGARHRHDRATNGYGPDDCFERTWHASDRDESADAPYYAAFRDLTCVYLEDSWVLKVTPTEYELRFVVEAVLTPEHAAYQPAKRGEQHCYRQAILVLSSTEPISFEHSETPPARDATDELDYGNIDTFTQVDWEGTAAWELTGDWGRAIVKQPTVVLTLGL